MSETATPTVPTAPDERLAGVNIVARLVARPDIGAFAGAVAVFFLFAYTARNVSWLSDLGIWSQWMDQSAQYGIVAVPVALLMIGGEFDLSAGVMVGSSGLLLGLLTTEADWNVWPSIAVVLVFGMAIGFINGYTVVKPEAAELHRHARRRSSSSRASTPAARSRSPARSRSTASTPPRASTPPARSSPRACGRRTTSRST